MKYLGRFLEILGTLIVGAFTASCGGLWSRSTVPSRTTTRVSFYGASSIGTTACRLFMVKNIDASGTLTSATNDTQVTLSGNGSGTFYSDAGCTQSSNLVTIPQGRSYSLFYFKDNIVENLTFRVSSLTLNSPSLSVATVTGGTASWTNKTPSLTQSPPALFAQAAAHHLLRNKIVIYGGETSGNTFNTVSADMWEYDGTTWTQVCSSCSPGQRQAHALVYDVNRNVLVLFGGGTSIGTFQNDVWEWNGSTWTQRTDILGTPPSARGAVFAVYDSSRQRTVIFGGTDTTSTDLNDVYEYDGISWYHPLAGGAPSIRKTGGAYGSNNFGFDAVHNRTLIYGGRHLAAYYDDIYTWNGSSWTTQASPNSTGSARAGSFTSFDDSRNEFVILQGNVGAGTYEIDGSTFASVGPTAGDPAPSRDTGTLTYNPFTAKLVYYGGNTCGGGCNWNETWEYGAP